MLKYDCFNKNILHTIFFAFLFILPLAFSNSLLSIYDIRTPEVYAQSTEGDIDAEDLDAEDLDAEDIAVEAVEDLIESTLSSGNSSSSNSHFNFAAGGDFSCNENTEETIGNIVSKNPEIVLALGDLSYSHSAECWIELMEPLEEITMITLGNHDFSYNRFEEITSHYELDPPYYYSFNYGDVHFLSIATDEFDYQEGSEQYQFVVEDLKTASSNPNIKWIVAFYHGPMFTENSDMDYETLRDIYAPLFDQYKVDLALQGHVHNYHRTFPLQYNEDDPEDPIIHSNGTIYTVVHSNGTIYTVVGSAGVSLEEFEDYLFPNIVTE
jgi:predicted phosphohydrolase